MTRIVIVGEMFYSDLSIGGGPIIPGPGQPSHPWVPPGQAPGYPSHPIYNPPYPDQGLPPGSPGSPTHPWVPPQAGVPSHPIYNPAYPAHPIYNPPPGYWGGVAPPHPDQGLPPIPPGTPSHPWVPPEGEQLPPPPEDIADSTVVAVWKPETQTWTVTVYEPSHQPEPTPQA
jgi:hypothetical protein